MERSLHLKNRAGLHARPISRIVELVQSRKARVQVQFEGRRADASSILEMMTLGAGPGARLTFVADGEDAEAALDALEALIEARFDEE